MSSDNGVYVLKLRTVEIPQWGDVDWGDHSRDEDFSYYVVTGHAVENIDLGWKELFNFFEDSVVFTDMAKALHYASLIDETHQTEFGVLQIDGYSNLTWDQIERYTEGHVHDLLEA